MNRRTALVFGTMTLSGLALSASTAAAQQKTLKEQLAGAWTLVSSIVTSPDASKRDFFPNGKGVLILDASGQWAQIFVRADVPKFKSNSRMEGTSEENKAAVQGTSATFGSWTVDEASKTLTQHYVGSLFPNQAGTDSKVTIVKLAADELTLHQPVVGAGGSADTVYRRAR
jgi:hypothetical protein